MNAEIILELYALGEKTLLKQTYIRQNNFCTLEWGKLEQSKIYIANLRGADLRGVKSE